jgi:hypothetical protein
MRIPKNPYYRLVGMDGVIGVEGETNELSHREYSLVNDFIKDLRGPNPGGASLMTEVRTLELAVGHKRASMRLYRKVKWRVVRGAFSKCFRAAGIGLRALFGRGPREAEEAIKATETEARTDQ